MTLKLAGQLLLVIVVSTAAAVGIAAPFHSPVIGFLLGFIFSGVGSTYVLSGSA